MMNAAIHPSSFLLPPSSFLSPLTLLDRPHFSNGPFIPIRQTFHAIAWGLPVCVLRFGNTVGKALAGLEKIENT
jgi:hypothetical protein